MSEKEYLHRFTPTVCKGEGAAWEGDIILKVPAIGEMMIFDNELETDVDGLEREIEKALSEDGKKKKELTEAEKRKEVAKRAARGMKKMGHALIKIGEYVKRVELTHKETGERYQSWDDLTHDPDARIVCMEVYGIFMKGYKPTKNL